MLVFGKVDAAKAASVVAKPSILYQHYPFSDLYKTFIGKLNLL